MKLPRFLSRNRSFMYITILSSLALILAFSMTHVQHKQVVPQNEAEVMLDVVFVKQKPWYCSEASASMVLNYYGFKLTQDEIHDMGYESFEQMYSLMSKYVRCTYGSLTFDQVRDELRKGNPVMARISIGPYRHTVVIVGYGENSFFIHDPARGPSIRISEHQLKELWEPTGFLAMNFSKA